MARTESGVFPLCAYGLLVVLWLEQVVTACMISLWFLAGTESGVSPFWCFLCLWSFCACGFCGFGLGAAGKRIRKEGKRKMFICIAKIS